ncbi:MAG: hypothetical protein OXC40_01265, partial [Proteobacteria bacterium]|nr:hypothetical protein [Pseudomonadota bacterium]
AVLLPENNTPGMTTYHIFHLSSTEKLLLVTTLNRGNHKLSRSLTFKNEIIIMRLSLEQQDFNNLRTGPCCYVGKTDFVCKKMVYLPNSMI